MTRFPIKSITRTAKSVMQFAVGEAAARLCMLGVYAFTTRHFGIAVFGAIALAQTVSNYVTYAGDQGYKLIGARLVARDQSLIWPLIRIIVPRRIGFACIAALAGCAYAFWGPTPANARGTIAIFALAAIPASAAVDWVLWGKGAFRSLSNWKGMVALVSSAIAIAGMLLTRRPLASISAGNLLAAITGSAVLWIYASRRWKRTDAAAPADAIGSAAEELRTGKVLSLGTSNLLNLVFTNSDLLLLAAMADATEVGNYAAATRLLFVIFSAYYLLTNTLYPTFSRITDPVRLRRIVLPSIAVLFVAGAALSGGLALYAGRILSLLYGSSFAAEHLLRVLVIALPFELVVSLLGTVLASQGRHGIMLRSLGAAAALNVGLNLFFIPKFHAAAAAWSTVAAYALLATTYVVCFANMKTRDIAVSMVEA